MRSEPGTPAAAGSIPLCVPEIRGNEWNYVKECLDTNWVSSVGSYVDTFEENLANYVGTRHAVATVSGTAALHIALLVSGVQPDDEVLVSTLSFIAPANAIRYTGAWPVFMDAEPRYWQMDPEKVSDFLDKECQWRDGCLVNRSTNRRVKAILPVHILGHPCDMEPIMAVARKYNLVVVEDATETLGATYQGKMVGHLGDIACFSFNGNKLITTGGGGMIVTDHPDWAARSRYLTTQAKDDPVEYLHNEIGYNYRLTNIQAALGVAQLEQIEDFIAKKRAIASAYTAAFRDMETVTLMPAQACAEPTWWLYTILLPEGTPLAQRQAAIHSLNQAGIGARPLWHTLHDLPPYRDCQSFHVEQGLHLYQRGISLPSSVGLTDSELAHCVDAVTKTLVAMV
ncbi:MAG: LegC family aminotransferase [Dehalococcoidia bacterium]